MDRDDDIIVLNRSKWNAKKSIDLELLELSIMVKK